MRDPNEADKIIAMLKFSPSTSNALMGCNCTEINGEDRWLAVNLPNSYVDETDELLIELSDGRISNTYSIQIINRDFYEQDETPDNHTLSQ